MPFSLVQVRRDCNFLDGKNLFFYQVEMFKVRMQGQYGAATDKRLRTVVAEMWRDWGFRKGIMRGYWVCKSVIQSTCDASMPYS